MKKMICAALLLAPALPAHAATRTFSVTDYDRIRVDGPFIVTVVTGKGASARANGSQQSLDRVEIRTEGSTILIRPNKAAWSGWAGKSFQPAEIILTAPKVRSVALTGTGRISITRMVAPRAVVALAGNGAIEVGSVEGDNLYAALEGAGSLKVAGRVQQASLTGSGRGTLDSVGLQVKDVTVTWQSSGDATIAASRTAKVFSSGSGNTTIIGKPTCTVTAVGAGQVRCGDGPKEQ